MSQNLFTSLSRHFPALAKTCIERPGGGRLTYGDLMAESAQLAHVLRGKGVAPGDRVAVQVEKSVEAILLYLATIRLGAIFLPLNTAYTAAELDYFIGDAEPVMVVCDPRRADEIGALTTKHQTKRLETMAADGSGSLATAMRQVTAADFADAANGPDDIAAILYTSGTTGRSKGAMLSHDNLFSNAATLKNYWRFTGDDVLLHALPIFHTHGLFVATNVILAAGASMIFLPRFDADEIMRLMPRATSLMGVPTFYVRLLQHPGLNRQATSHMRLFISGSAPLLSETHQQFRTRTGHAILERYGMTETNMNTSNPYDGERIAGTVGFPLPGITIRVTEPETGKVIGADEIGMLEIKGPNVFKGYWRNPEKTKAEFRADGFFITGDLGKIDARGYVHIIGRGKDLIISGGYNVYPKEVESEIDLLPGVVESAVIGVPHPDFGEAVVAVIVREKGAQVSAANISAALAERLARYKQPKHIAFLEDLPRNTMGKVQKNILRESYKDLFQG
ncbi:MAG: malonyl-CoA synthase [Rhodospirillaceae bacterium]|nr:MAG: malonyl-CoA synthase [Rhodospirillaceae bacterium]